MIVGPLKKGLQSSLTVIALFFIGFIAFSSFSVNFSESTDSRNILYSFLQSRVSNNIVNIVINCLCILTGTVLISVYTIRNEIADKQNYLPPFLYLFLSSLLPGKELLHPSLMANCFILIGLIYLSDSYREDNALSKLFNAAFFTSLAFFFYLNYVTLTLLFFIALFIFRPFNWRELVVSLLGFAAPVFIYSCLGYLFDFDFLKLFSDVGTVFYLKKPVISEYCYPLLIALIILLLLGVLKHASQGLGSKIKSSKNMSIIYWFLVLSVFCFFTREANHYFPMIASIIPVSVLLGDYFFNIKQLKIANTLLFLLIAAGSVLVIMRLGAI